MQIKCKFKIYTTTINRTTIKMLKLSELKRLAIFRDFFNYSFLVRFQYESIQYVPFNKFKKFISIDFFL